MRKILLLILLLGLLLPTPCFAAEEMVSIDGVSISVGQDEAGVRAKLSGKYDFRPVSGEAGKFVLMTKKEPAESPGSVVFAKGKVVEVTRSWGTFPAGREAEQFLTLIGSATGQYGMPAFVEVRRDPRSTVQTVEITFASRKITIEIKTTTAGNSLSLTETVY